MLTVLLAGRVLQVALSFSLSLCGSAVLTGLGLWLLKLWA